MEISAITTSGGGGGSLHFARRTLGARIQLSRALMWDTDLLLVKCAVIPEAKRRPGPVISSHLGCLSARIEGASGDPTVAPAARANTWKSVAFAKSEGGGGGWAEPRVFKTHMCMMSVSCRGSCLICGLTMAGWGIPVACGPGGPGTMWCENL